MSTQSQCQSPSPPSLHLQGQRVLVTGAGRGIGRAIALICAEQGAKVAISSRTPAELEETVSLALASMKSMNMDTMMDSYVADVTNPHQVDSMVQSIVQKWGGIDILINNAGGGQGKKKGPFQTLDSNDLSNLLNLNVVSIHVVTSAVLRHAMLSLPQNSPSSSSSSQAGKIINISSRAGKMGIPQISFYVASKFAVEGLTASLAQELQDQNINIHVNTLSPGMVHTKSFPKPAGKQGVRTAESVQDGLLVLLESNVTGHYLHVDELDAARACGLEDHAAIKPINEAPFICDPQTNTNK